MSKHKSCETHCCLNHGCSYGHKDCPVENGKIAQVYLCEMCDVDGDGGSKTIVVHAKIHLKRADGTVKDIPSEDAVLSFIEGVLLEQDIQGWSLVKAH